MTFDGPRCAWIVLYKFFIWLFCISTYGHHTCLALALAQAGYVLHSGAIAWGREGREAWQGTMFSLNKIPCFLVGCLKDRKPAQFQSHYHAMLAGIQLIIMTALLARARSAQCPAFPAQELTTECADVLVKSNHFHMKDVFWISLSVGKHMYWKLPQMLLY